MTQPVAPARKPVVGIALIYACVLIAAWIGAWMLSLYLEKHAILPATQFARFVYWTVLRVLIWVLPSVAIIRRSGRRFRDALGAGRIRSALLWGGVSGVLVGCTTLIFRAVRGMPLFSIDWSWALLTAVVVGPIVEEITFRGAVLGALEARCSFAVSNLITGVLFLLIHFPGWYFQGALMRNLVSPVGGALSVLLLGWLFGYIAHRSKSLAGGILVHMLNNFFAA
ncbi:MAG: CPBP family intramembrane metalloprotease [Clostridiales bacterium]|nr:CPBP family intramembrane metalloprotease [Clostridiales bacterium]